MTQDGMELARKFADACDDALRTTGHDAVVAAIVHGSLVFDDFVAGRSDIDLLIVVDVPLSEAGRAAVQASGTRWCDESPHTIDLRVVTRAAAWRPRRMPEMELSIGCHGSGFAIEPRGVEPDLLVEFSVARGHGQSLIGPEPRFVVGAVPHRWIIEDSDEQLARWESLTDDEQHAELMVLTACRMWRFAVEGVHCSKTQAGLWALARDPSLGAIGEALDQRGGGSQPIGEDGIRRVLAAARTGVGGALRGSPPLQE